MPQINIDSNLGNLDTILAAVA